jgi:hypothetical protein
MQDLWYYLPFVELSRKTQNLKFHNEVPGAAARYFKFQELVHLYNVGHVHNVCHLLTASKTIRIKWEVKVLKACHLRCVESKIQCIKLCLFTYT